MVLLYLAKDLESLKSLQPKDIQALEDLAVYELNSLLEKQFYLSYFVNVSKESTDNMTPIELDRWVELLKKQKELENSQVE